MDELKDRGANLYSIASHSAVKLQPNTHKVEDFKPRKIRYLVNHDKKVFVGKTKVPKDSDGWQIHPLPLLTCEGNGRGGGDFRGVSDLVGSWSRDIISAEKLKADIPKDYTEVIFNLTE